MSSQNKPNTEEKKCTLPCVFRHVNCAKPTLQLANKPIVWVLGGPGCGKGTQCHKIVAQYGFSHLSTGDLLRDEVKTGSERGKTLAAVMKKGKLVRNDVVLKILKEAIAARVAKFPGFLIDGYPREKHQGVEFETAIAPVTVILYFETSRENLIKRMRGRALTSGRFDDNEETINLRMQTFFENNQQVLDQYPSKLCKIDADRSVDAIFSDVKKILDPIVARLHPDTATN